MSRKLITKIILRNDVTQNWLLVADTMVLLRGEIGLEYTEDNTVKMKIGDGVSTWGQLPYFISENGSDAVLPENFTWADLLGVAPEGETTSTINIGLVKPALADKVEVDILNANAEIIDTNIFDLTEKISSLTTLIEENVNQIRVTLADYEGRITALENNSPEIDSAELETLKTSVAELTERVVVLENRQPTEGGAVDFTEINNAIAALDKRIVAIEESFVKKEELTSVKEEFNKTLENYTTREDLSSVKEIVYGNTERITEVENFTKKLEEQAGRVNVQLVEMTEKDKNFEERITAIEENGVPGGGSAEVSPETLAQIEANTTNIATLTGTVGGFDERITAVETTVAGYDVKIEEAVAATNAIEGMQATITETTERMTAVETSMEETNANVSAITERVETTAGSIEEFEGRITTTEGRLTELIQATSNGELDGVGEVIDARVAANGDSYPTLGDHVRALDTEVEYVKNNTADLIGGKLVDNLSYENYMLQLMAGDTPIGTAVEIKGGSGGGGGPIDGTYTAKLENLLDSRMISVPKGEKVVLKYKYTSVDAEGTDDGDGIGIITVDNVIKSRFRVIQGEVETDITDYLVNGTNTVKLTVENSEGVAKNIIYTVTVIALTLTTPFATMNTYSGNVGFQYTITGNGSKVIHFIMDDDYELATEVVTAVNATRTFTIPKQVDGAHIFSVYAETVTEGTTIRSEELRLGMMWTSTEMTEKAVLINYNGGEKQQGEIVQIPYLVYDPFSQNADVFFSIYNEDGSLYYESEPSIVDQTAKIWSVQDFPEGNTIFRVTAGNKEDTAETNIYEEVTIKINPSSFTNTVIDDNLLLDFNARNKTNYVENPDHWEYSGIVAEFDNFNWAEADGWVTDKDGASVLRFLPGGKMVIPFKPFESDIRNSGYTIEAEFATNNVRDYDSVVIDTYSGGRGLIIRSQNAALNSEQSGVGVQFKEDARIRLTFVVEQNTLNRFVYVYIDGILCGITQYSLTDNFKQTDPVDITIGAETCGLDLYNLRFYGRAFSIDEQLNNFMCDRSTLEERIAVRDRNAITDESGKITVNNISLSIPYMIMECPELPQFKGDKKKGMSVKYVDGLHPDYSFEAVGCEFDVQGTSSAGYPVKNFKVKLKNGLTYTASGEYADGWLFDKENSLPTEVFCLKADYASSEHANNVMLVDYYDKVSPYRMPPQQIDDRVRSGVNGKAIVVFWHNTDTGEVTFQGCYNMNDDKSNEQTFGFVDIDVTSLIPEPRIECWEWCNNSNDLVLFLDDAAFDQTKVDEDGKPYPAWQDDFEPRFPDLDDHMYGEQEGELDKLRRMVSWVVSTRQDTATNEAITPVTLPHYLTGVATEYTADTAEYRLAKFKSEFEDYFEMDAMTFYYIFTEVFLMVDNRAKNMFLTTFDGDHWFPIPYDMDTAIGINNEGALAFEYHLEDTDYVDGEKVYNGQDSVLWINFRMCFPSEIRTMYQELRSNNENPFSYQAIYEKMKKHQETWPEVAWNWDAQFKYLEPFHLGSNNLAMLQGNKASQRDWWLYNAFKYRDSKYQAGESLTNYIHLRLYEAGEINIVPYSHLYTRVKFGQAKDETQRTFRDQTARFTTEGIADLNDLETHIYSADRLVDIGDLSALKIGYCDVSPAIKLGRLILGSEADGYVNPNLKTLNIGRNELLQEIDVSNCTGLGTPDKTGAIPTAVIDASKCPSLEVLKAKGTSVLGANFTDGGRLREVYLPGTVTSITLRNQHNLETFELESYANISTILIDNTANMPIEEMVANAGKLDRVRITNQSWNATDEASLLATIRKLAACDGLSADGSTTLENQPIVTGRAHVSAISEAALEEINTLFPELVVVVNGIPKLFMRYLNYDNTLLYRYVINAGDDAIDPVAKGYITAPDREDTETAKYDYIGWSELPTNVQKAYNIVAKYAGQVRIDFRNLEGEIINSQWVALGGDAKEPVSEGLCDVPKKPSTAQYDYEFSGWNRSFEKVENPIVLDPEFEPILRRYKVFFMNDSELIEEHVIFYGSTATFTGDTTKIKKKIGGQDSIYYEFTGWSPNPDEPITGNVWYYAQFLFDGYITDDWATIAAACASGDVSKYGLGGRKKMSYSIDGGQNYSEVEMEIAGINHDNLVSNDPNYNGGTGKAALTFIAKVLGNEARIMNQTMHYIGNNGSMNTGGWAVSDLRIWMNGGESDGVLKEPVLLTALPKDLQTVIKPVIKKSDKGFYNPVIIDTIDKIWIPSDRELNCEHSGQVTVGQGEPYAVYTDANSRKKSNAAGGVKTYWSRSTGREGQQYYRYIDSQGHPANGVPQSQNHGIALGFCI